MQSSEFRFRFKKLFHHKHWVYKLQNLLFSLKNCRPIWGYVISKSLADFCWLVLNFLCQDVGTSLVLMKTECLWLAQLCFAKT